MNIDFYLQKKPPYTNVTHIARGILNDSEKDNYSPGIIRVICREFSCNITDTSSLDVFLEEPFLTCSYCNSANITIEWIEFCDPIYQMSLDNIPQEGFHVNSHLDPFYGYIYHKHFQREI